MTTKIRFRRGIALVSFGAAFFLSGCSDDKPGAFVPPAPGSAVQVGVPPSGEKLYVDHSTGYSDFGTIELPDGTILGHRGDPPCLSTLRPAAKPQTVRCLTVKPDKQVPVGFARTPDGKVYFGWGTVLYAGTPPRLDDFKGVSGPGYPVLTDNTPIGARSDGTVIVIGQKNVWEFRQGALTSVYQLKDLHWPRPDAQPEYVGTGTAGFVDPQDTIWIAPDRGDPQTHGLELSLLEDVVGITKTGTPVWPKLPQQIPGVPGDLAKLEVVGMISDGHGGFFFRVEQYRTTPQYVIHVTADGAGTLVAASDVDPDDQAARNVKMSGPTDALHIPLYLPKGMVLRPGALILGGAANYAVAVGLPQN
ncbi:hypothetical protein [Catenulispora subtropica]|uniref:ScyD/ScyE family protein n=1 Tax=Catenulispora subtropica TaxID=450798 RepID=A0ABN2SGE3_9ACTN